MLEPTYGSEEEAIFQTQLENLRRKGGLRLPDFVKRRQQAKTDPQPNMSTTPPSHKR